MSRNVRICLRRVLVPLLAVMVLVACSDNDGDGTGPTPPEIDPGEAQAILDSLIENFIDDNEGLESLDGVTDFITQITGQPSVARFDQSWRDHAGGLATLPKHLRGRLAVVPGHGLTTTESLIAAAIPSQLLGATLVWDVQQGAYVEDPDRTGAPPDGVRFILYTPDPVTGLPLEILEEIGYVDIIDASSLPSLDVSIEAVINDIPVLDYGVVGTFSDTDFDLDMSGILSDGVSQLTFGFLAASTATSSTLSYDVGLGTFSATFAFDEGPDTIRVTATVTDLASGDEIVFNVGFDELGVVTDDSGVLFNGESVAEISGTADGVLISAPDGSPLRASDLQALSAVFSAVQEILFVQIEFLAFGVANTGGTLIVE